ncbi:MAG: hypothetical protein JEZ00_13000 [Anaerolineaceae bacterium]|nr:hypothetical protein [Anaerolineaceae bacterium]
MRITKNQAKSIFVASKIPDTDYCVNPYTGCQFGCLYCYAAFSCRFVNEPRSEWGNFIAIKENAVELAKKQLSRWPKGKQNASIFFSSITDPYQGIEKEQQLTRGILSELVHAGYQGKVSILTKSPLVLRDMDLFKQLNADIGLTITTTDDKLGRFLEVRAPLESKRLETLAKLNQIGLRTYAFVGPLLPHYRQQPDQLESIFQHIAQAGTREIYAEQLNLGPKIRQRIWAKFAESQPDWIPVYQKAVTAEHRALLADLVLSFSRKYKLHLRLNEAIYHQDMKKK